MLIKFKQYSNKNVEFLSMDNEETFKANLETMPDNWIWRNKKIFYKTNKYGYRADEFETIDWNNYFLTFGDSNVFGIGLSNELIFPNIVAEKLAMKAVNLAIPGTGSDFVYYNFLTFLKNSVNIPKFIVISWPNVYRKLWFLEKENYCWIPQFSHENKNYKKIDDMSLSLSSEVKHSLQQFRFQRETIKIICELKGIKMIEFSMHAESQYYTSFPDIPVLIIDKYVKDQNYFNDFRARDYTKKHGSHYGPNFHQFYANYIVNNL
jgi:hypothetical protein